jgi:hypothetical protein
MNLELITLIDNEFKSLQTIEIGGIPPVGSIYHHAQTKKSYSVHAIHFSDKIVIAQLVELAGRPSLDPFVKFSLIE